jgi:hypothetical protein
MEMDFVLFVSGLEARLGRQDKVLAPKSGQFIVFKRPFQSYPVPMVFQVNQGFEKPEQIWCPLSGFGLQFLPPVCIAKPSVKARCPLSRRAG